MKNLLDKQKELLSIIETQRCNMYDEFHPADMFVFSFLYLEYIREIVNCFQIPL